MLTSYAIYVLLNTALWVNFWIMDGQVLSFAIDVIIVEKVLLLVPEVLKNNIPRAMLRK